MLKDIVENVRKNQEETVFEYIFQLGIDVDKDELIKALKYDREQYSKGFEDALQQLREKCLEHQDFHKGDDGKFRGWISIEDLDYIINEVTEK